MIYNVNNIYGLRIPERMIAMSRRVKRVLMTVIGVLLTGVCVGFADFANLGFDPFQVFAHGIWNLTPLDFGTAYLILNVVLLIAMLIFARKKIGIGTLINLFLLGYVAAFVADLLKKLFPDPSLVLRIVVLLVGLLLMCLASALYFEADLGVSTYDFIALTICEKKPSWPFRFVRVATDLLCVAIGTILGTMPGVGTIITAFFMGPFIEFFRKHVAAPMLKNVPGGQA